MALLGLIFSGFLGALAIVACLRSARIVIGIINSMFDRLEERFRN